MAASPSSGSGSETASASGSFPFSLFASLNLPVSSTGASIVLLNPLRLPSSPSPSTASTPAKPYAQVPLCPPFTPQDIQNAVDDANAVQGRSDRLKTQLTALPEGAGSCAYFGTGGSANETAKLDDAVLARLAVARCAVTPSCAVAECGRFQWTDSCADTCPTCNFCQVTLRSCTLMMLPNATASASTSLSTSIRFVPLENSGAISPSSVSFVRLNVPVLIDTASTTYTAPSASATLSPTTPPVKGSSWSGTIPGLSPVTASSEPGSSQQNAVQPAAGGWGGGNGLAIAGGVAGAIVAIALAAGVLIWSWRRRADRTRTRKRVSVGADGDAVELKRVSVGAGGPGSASFSSKA
ncbi:hypothetical protein HDU96_005214 [Phlyctochytrium bullatum]|nr:hypothetical protein HDU96_005214 [Phlyctochytrium bullatum]